MALIDKLKEEHIEKLPNHVLDKLKEKEFVIELDFITIDRIINKLKLDKEGDEWLSYSNAILNLLDCFKS